LKAVKAQLKADLGDLNDDADPGDAGAGAVNPPTACGPADKPRCMGRPLDYPIEPGFYVQTTIIGAPPIDRSEQEQARRARDMKALARPMTVLKCPNWRACALFLVIMRAVWPAFKAATDEILAEDTELDRTNVKIRRSKNIVAAMHLFDDLPPEYKPKITMDSAWEAVRDVFNAVRDAAGKQPLCVDEVKSMLEKKGGVWAAKRDVFEEKEMFTGGWRLMDGKVTVEGMVDGNAAKELPPAKGKGVAKGAKGKGG
jgi:hypothetical protein